MFWYEEEVKTLENKALIRKGKRTKVLFYGSSSMRLWSTLSDDFKHIRCINQAFGGSTLAACCWFFNRLVPQHKPEVMVIYAGDNDLGDGRHPEEIFFFFKDMMQQIKESCGDIPVAFMSIKQSPARKHLAPSITFTNQIIQQLISEHYPHCTFVDIVTPMLKDGEPQQHYFMEDGLHLSPQGYEVWRETLYQKFLHQF